MKSYSIEEIAEQAGVHPRTVHDWITFGELRAVNFSRSRASKKKRLRVLETDWQVFLASRSVGGPKEKPATRKRQRAESPIDFF